MSTVRDVQRWLGDNWVLLGADGRGDVETGFAITSAKPTLLDVEKAGEALARVSVTVLPRHCGTK